MPAKFTYLLIDLGAFLVPLIFSFHPRIRFDRMWKYFWPANLIAAALFIMWDSLYTRWGVWGFNEKYILGIYIFNLPVEEILFFICIPYSSIFSYHCFKLFLPKATRFQPMIISVVLITLLTITGLIHLSKLYTGFTFISLAIIILMLSVKRKTWLPNFYFMYLVILLPFFVVNGILTGTGPDAPVVWYNDSENLGLRLLTIPIEDVFYGMLLLLLNTFLFESFIRLHAGKKNTDNSF